MYCEVVGIYMTSARHTFLRQQTNRTVTTQITTNNQQQNEKGQQGKGETEGCIQGEEERQERGNRVLI
jgi:hypothetical protein